MAKQTWKAGNMLYPLPGGYGEVLQMAKDRMIL